MDGVSYLRNVTVEDEVGDRAAEQDYQQLAKEQQQVTYAVQNLVEIASAVMCHASLEFLPQHGEGSLQPDGRLLWQRNRSLCSVNDKIYICTSTLG